jgi:hypothetical protein
VEESRGMLRAGPVHNNTVEEIHQFSEALGRITTPEYYQLTETAGRCSQKSFEFIIGDFTII